MHNPYEGEFISPLSIQVSKNKKFILNLNQYRNTHFFTLNKAKQLYSDLMVRNLIGTPKLEEISLTLTLYPKNNQMTDLDNVCSIHTKFFQDCLVKAKVIPEDTYKHIKQINYLFGSVDKENPRVEIIIKDLTPMKIQFTLEEAVAIIRSTNEVFENAEITIESVGTTTEEAPVQTQQEEVKPKRKRRTKAEIEAEKNGTNTESVCSSDEDSQLDLTEQDSDIDLTKPLFETSEQFEETNEDEEPIVVNDYADQEMAMIDEVLNEVPDEIAQTEEDDIIDLSKPLFG